MEELDAQGQKELEALGLDANEDEINAVYRRGQARYAQRRWPQKQADQGLRQSSAAARPSSRPDSETTCPNCGEKGHKKEACPKEKVPLEERKCFICGRPGHRASQCPDKDRKPVNNVETNENRQRPKDAFVVEDAEDSEGFIPVQRRRLSAARPVAATFCKAFTPCIKP